MYAIDRILIDGGKISVDDIAAVARYGAKVEISPMISDKLRSSRKWVEKFAEDGKRIYGVTTGLGDLWRVNINKEDLSILSKNIIMSHACGVGDPLTNEQVRAITLCQIINFSQGHSGIRYEVVDTLIQMLNKDVFPWVPSQGSVGYLTHMAHIALVAIGRGQAYYNDQLIDGLTAMNNAGIPILTLQEKEGLALVNGTACMTGIGALVVYDAKQLSKWASISAAMSFEALKGTPYAFDARIQEVRPYRGQKLIAQKLLRLMEGSEILEKHKDDRVQDALSLRAIPQVHGACLDKIEHAEEILSIEINSATDNPLLFEDAEGPISISACNAHGEPVAITMDMLTIAVSELASISERRNHRLVNPHVSELPDFLINDNGRNTGFMITQYVAASLVAENKVLSHPISVDSITMSALQEDHVSMGTPAALKANIVVRNTQKVIALELLTAAQALDFHRPLRFGQGTELAHQLIRSKIPFWTEDREFYPFLQTVISMVEDARTLEQLENDMA